MILKAGTRSPRYYSSGSLHGLIMSRPLTLPYHIQQHVIHDMRAALTSENAWMITNRDSSTGQTPVIPSRKLHLPGAAVNSADQGADLLKHR